MKNRKWLGNGLLLLTAIIWGSAFVSQRMGMDSLSPFTFCASRMTLSAAAVGALAFVLHLRKKAAPSGVSSGQKRSTLKNTLLGGAVCGSFLASASLVQQAGLVTTGAGKAGFITALYILLVPVISTLVLKKKYRPLVWIAVVTGVIGLYLLCVTENLTLTKGDVLVCICAVLFTGHILCCDHFSRLGDPLEISAVQFVTAALISWAAAFLAEKPAWENILAAAGPIVYCGIASGGIGYTLQMIAQSMTDPTSASLLMSFEAVFAVLTGVIVLGESMSGREILGCVLMFAAILLVQMPAAGGKEESEQKNGASS